MAKKSLLLLRHAKSSWKNPELDDRDRPLNARGRLAADRIGRLLVEERLIPDLVLCSTAKRTCETAVLVFTEQVTSPTILYRHDLYHAEPIQIADILSQIAEPVQCVMIIGHNPGLEDFLTQQTGETLSLPTGALARIDFELDTWGQFNDVLLGTLVQHWRPRELESD